MHIRPPGRKREKDKNRRISGTETKRSRAGGEERHSRNGNELGVILSDNGDSRVEVTNAAVELLGDILREAAKTNN